MSDKEMKAIFKLMTKINNILLEGPMTHEAIKERLLAAQRELNRFIKEW